MDLILRFAIFTVLVLPALFLGFHRFHEQGELRFRPLFFQIAILYSLCEVLAAAEADYFLLSLVTAIFAGLNACNLTHFLVYRTPISASAFGEIIFSTSGEWFDYVASQRRTHLALSVLYFVACAAALAVFHAAPPPDEIYTLPAGLALGGLLTLTFLRGNAGNFYPLRYAYQIAEAASELKALNRLVSSSTRRDFAATASPPPERQKFVIVIGEAVRRSNLSIHGYQRDTTPELAALANELVIFEDAISPANLTRVSLRLALTPGSVASGDGFGEWKSIVQAARAAGFETHWISNQPRLGSHETEVSAIAGEAEHVHFFNTEIQGRVPDGRMLPTICEVLGTDRPSVIFVHMMGSHPRYENRVEDGFQPYTTDTGYRNAPSDRKLATDNYDNTIRYLDHFLGRIVDACRDSERPCLLTFFSDHGEVLFDDGASLYHGLVNPLQKEYEVPYFFWAAPAFRERYPENIVCGLPQRIPGRAHLQCLFDDMALIMGLQIDGYETGETNLRALPVDGPDDRKVFGRDTMVDYVTLP